MIRVLETATRLLSRPGRLPDQLVRRSHRASRRREMLFRYVAWLDRRRAGSGPASVPSAALRFRVHGELDLDGFLQTGRKCSRDLPGRGFPGWYQLATHTEEYFPRRYSEYVEVVRFLPKAMDGCQDIVILRRG